MAGRAIAQLAAFARVDAHASRVAAPSDICQRMHQVPAEVGRPGEGEDFSPRHLRGSRGVELEVPVAPVCERSLRHHLPVSSEAWAWTDSDDVDHTWANISAWADEWWRERRAEGPSLDAPAAGQVPTPAMDCLMDLTLFNPNRSAVDLIVALAAKATGDEDFADLGAGDIETLVVHGKRAAEFIDAVEEAAQASPNFAKALTFMWVGADTPEPLRTRLLNLGAIDLTKPLPR